MKRNFPLWAVLGLLIISCKTDKKSSEEAPMDMLQQVAYAHGYDNWKNISEIRFTFNVDRDTTHFERDWIWRPKTKEIIGMSKTDTVRYYSNLVDHTVSAVDASFTNDQYWLLAPYHLIWDRDFFSWEQTGKTEAPISGEPMEKITIVYEDKGGYTPGDAYDFYLGDDLRIREWTFRKGNQEEPSMHATWEGWETLEGLRLSTMHVNKDSGAKIHFTNLQVKTVPPLN